MRARLIFFAIAAFWLAMNVMLWRSEYGSRGGETPVPIGLVWKKILTAPDPSSLYVYQNGARTGFCEFSTSVGREMAAVDADKPPPEGLLQRAGYQIHLSGNVALGNFTNRLKFAGQLQFSSADAWSEVNFKVSSHLASVEVHSVATNQNLRLKITGNGLDTDVTVRFTDLQNPNALLRTLTGNAGGDFLDAFELPGFAPLPAGQKLAWRASRTRVKIGTEAVPVYQLETSFLGRAVLVDVSTIGEILRVELPGNLSARIDEWVKP
jgi:hypothetical protein